MQRVIVGILLVIAMDQTLGFALGLLYQRTTTGESGGVINFVLTQAPDILIFGSSRAKHHIDPAILSQHLSFSAFNAGNDGHDFLYAMMLFDLWKRLHAPPRAIILHVDAASFSKNETELQKTSVFAYYMDQSELVRRIILMRGRYEALKLLSSSYRFNGKFLAILKNQFVAADTHDNGYSGLSGQLEWPGPLPQDVEKSHHMATRVFWQEKLTYFQALADYCAQHGTRLFLVHSPRFSENPREYMAWTSALSHVLISYPHVEFIDISEHTYPEAFAGRAELYRDIAHLNMHGARLFSRLLAQALEGKVGL